MRTHLLIIDPQNDFCDLPAASLPPQTQPALPVPGAHADMQRLAQLLHSSGNAFAAISITLDSHHRIDIAHPGFWQDAAGHNPPPFTQISLSDLQQGRWRPRQPQQAEWVARYLRQLDAQGRYQLMIWPVHCQIGTWGQAIHSDLLHACNDWEDRHARSIQLIHKGAHPLTEHYSALCAEVPVEDAPETGLNHALLQALAQAEHLIVAGEAGSHCVKASVEHLLQYAPQLAPRLTLLRDAISAVAGFEAQYAEFLQRCAAQGVRIATCDSLRASLAAA
ncbi:cysteine hydrolase [Massilia sp. W12]|uniref:cysteine hydrolase n=1 Tax=Massilia sp. W12 TaxID=3126507 RepID=UPI0030D4C491